MPLCAAGCVSLGRRTDVAVRMAGEHIFRGQIGAGVQYLFGHVHLLGEIDQIVRLRRNILFQMDVQCFQGLLRGLLREQDRGVMDPMFQIGPGGVRSVSACSSQILNSSLICSIQLSVCRFIMLSELVTVGGPRWRHAPTDCGGVTLAAALAPLGRRLADGWAERWRGETGSGRNGRRTGCVVAGRCTVKPQAARIRWECALLGRMRPESGWEKSSDGAIGWETSALFVRYNCDKLGRA